MMQVNNTRHVVKRLLIERPFVEGHSWQALINESKTTVAKTVTRRRKFLLWRSKNYSTAFATCIPKFLYSDRRAKLGKLTKNSIQIDNLVYTDLNETIINFIAMAAVELQQQTYCIHNFIGADKFF